DHPASALSLVSPPLGHASPTTLLLYAHLFEQAHHAAEARGTLEAIRDLGTARRPRTSFSEGNPRDRVAVLEAPVIGIEPARPGEGDQRCDEDRVVRVAAAVSGEVEGGGQEVDRAREIEGTAPGNGVRLARPDPSILEEEHRLHGSARGGGERSDGAAADRHG